MTRFCLIRRWCLIGWFPLAWNSSPGNVVNSCEPHQCIWRSPCSPCIPFCWTSLGRWLNCFITSVQGAAGKQITNYFTGLVLLYSIYQSKHSMLALLGIPRDTTWACSVPVCCCLMFLSKHSCKTMDPFHDLKRRFSFVEETTSFNMWSNLTYWICPQQSNRCRRLTKCRLGFHHSPESAVCSSRDENIEWLRGSKGGPVAKSSCNRA